MKLLERAARALCKAQSGVECFDDLEPEAQEIAIETVRSVILAIREPSPGMIATVVQQVGDPTPEQWALGERANATLTVTNMLGETACAEVARDWQSMIDALLAEQP